MLALTGSLLLGISASPAGAAAGDLTRTTVQRTTYSPGVRFTASQQTISITTINAPCVSTTRPDITSGTAAFTFTGKRSCLMLDQSSSGTSNIKWNTDETSVYTYISTSQTVAGHSACLNGSCSAKNARSVRRCRQLHGPTAGRPARNEGNPGWWSPTQALIVMTVLKRAYFWAALAAMSMYGCGYLMAWYAAWHTSVAKRDGLEWVYVFLLTLPWSLLARAGGRVVIHTGALINGTFLATFTGWKVRRRWPTPTS